MIAPAAPDMAPFPLARRQAEAAAETLTIAFLNDPLVTRICPEEATRAPLILPVFRYSANLAIHYGQAWGIDVSKPADSPCGVSLWLHSWRMICPPWRWFAYGGHKVGRGMAPEGYRMLNEVSFTIDRERDRIAPRRYLYLSNLGVLPECRRRGLATALVQGPCERAARQGLPVLVETNTPDSLAFYRAAGFGVVRSFKVWGMEYYILERR